ncbi:MAG: chitobiase/beta-hexosaminidase C-terminal domain-containing protein [Prevotella sp.]|nr:chitobiase/beta-hexosaminidase C-terminal domain-containing protein [Prevotella sp.]
MNKILRYSLLCLMTLFLGGSALADEHTVWAEDWSSSTDGAKVEDVSNSTATYVGDNGGYIKLYKNSNDASNLELLVPKKSRNLSFTANVALNGETSFKLTFTVNKNIDVTSSTEGAELTKTDNTNYTITVPDGTSTLSLTFATAVDQNARLDDIMLTSEDEVSGDVISAPTISGETSFEESTTVTITSTEEGATILYTVNGDDPTEAGQTYTEPFTLNATTTVKACVKKGDKFSSVASKTFTKVELSGVTTIAAFNALANDTKNVVLTLTNAKVLAFGNNCAVINDGTAGTELYNFTAVTLKQGDILNGTITGTKADYKGITEMKDISDNTLVVTEGKVEPTVATVAEVADAEIFGALYKLENVQVVKDGNNYYMKDGDTQMQVYNSLKIAGITLAEGQFNIEGVVGAYNAKQFLPTKFEAYVAPSDVPAPTISGDETFEEQTTVTITTEVEGGAIYYTTDGTDPATSSDTRQDYEEPIVITETTTIRACVENEEGELSSTVSKTFTKVASSNVANIAAFNALADKTKDVVLTLTNAQVLAKGGNYTIVADATAGTEFFKVTTPELKAGDIHNGTITGTKDSYYGVPELTSVSANTLTITEGTVTATAADVATIAEAPLFAKYYALENVEVVEEGGKFYMQSGETKVQVYDQFKLAGLTLAAGNYNIEGVVGTYNETKQFWPTKFEKNLGDKKDPALAFAEATYTAVLGEEFTSPELTNEFGVAAVWTSTNEAVATVDQNGVVTILAAGTTTITAASAETDEYVASQASYKLIVSDPSILEKGTFENPLTVADLLTLDVNAIPFTEAVWVKAVIIGSCKSSGALEETPETASNIAIADAAGETEKYVPVQLPADKDTNGNIRSTLNVVDHADNIGKEVMVKGDILKYMGRVGVKNTNAYVFNGIHSGISNVSVVANSQAPLYNLAGQRVGKDFKGVVIQNGKKMILK